ncbi:hypothetical protein [Desulfothermobacter acidiphilus]|uniref:hypothetical protein n=1 Tax=Desulfothermobacter acidiphilus TaxID=1938353 RepID=UPI003F89257C
MRVAEVTETTFAGAPAYWVIPPWEEGIREWSCTAMGVTKKKYWAWDLRWQRRE